METNIIYKYLAPGMPLGHESTITTATLDLNPNEVLSTVHPVGETVALQADDPEEHGEASKEYVVLNRYPFLTQLGDPAYTALILFVIITDPTP